MQQVAIGLGYSALGAAVAFIYGISAYCLGQVAYREDAAKLDGLAVPIRVASGAAIFSLLFSIFAVLGIANKWIVISIPAIILLTASIKAIATADEPYHQKLRSRLGRAFRAVAPANVWLPQRVCYTALCIAILLFAAYVATFSITPFRGNDLGVYHLVVPRDVLRDGGYIYNPFFFTSGHPWGWHMFGLPAYAAGGPAGYLALSFFAFVLTLVLVHQVSQSLFSELPAIGILSAGIAAYVIATNELSSISNNDIGALFLELLALTIAVRGAATPNTALVLGLVCGFAVAIKLIPIVPAALIYLFFIFRYTNGRLQATMIFSASFLPLAAFWPLVALWDSGSPLATYLNGPRLWGTALPMFSEATELFGSLFEKWYVANGSRFFTNHMVGNCVLLAMLAAGLCLAPKRYRNIGLFLVIFSVARMLGLAFSSGRFAFSLFHDRYNVVSFVLIGLSAVWTAYPAALNSQFSKRAVVICFGFIVAGISVVGLASRSLMRDPMLDGTVVTTVMPSILEQLWTQAEAIKYGSEIPYDEVVEYISHELPPDAIIATITIAPYQLNHRFIQVLPFTQNVIDLDQSPTEIETALRRHGACYLHLPYATSLNPWMNEAITKWVDRVRQTCRLPGARVLKAISVPPNYVTEVCKLPGC